MDGHLPRSTGAAERDRHGRAWHAPRWFRRLSIRWRLAAMAVLCLLPSTYFGLHDALNHRREHEGWARRNLETLMSMLALKYREDLTSAERNLRLLAQTYRFVTEDPVRCGMLLQFIVSQNADRYTNVLVVDRAGKDLCFARPSIRPTDANGSLLAQLREKPLAIGTLRRTADNKTMLPLAVLAVDNATGERLGAVGLGLDISGLARAVARADMPPHAYLGFMDAAGAIYGPGPAPAELPNAATLLRSAGDRPVFLSAGSGQNAATFVVAPLDRGRLYVIAGFPDSVVYGEAGSAAMDSFKINFLIVFCTFLLVWVATSRLALRPLRLLAGAVSGQDPNRRDFAYDTWNQPREIAELATAFAGYVANEHEYRRRMESLVEQRDLLLRELNHRVKNNLQLVMNLLSMQERRCGDEAVRRQLGQARARIGTMALLHRQLYAQGDTALVELKRYFEDLVRGIVALGSDAPRLIVTAPRLRVPIDLAIPLGMFLTEAVINALKHAFPDRTDGRVTVTLRLRPDGARATLEIRDNGIGMPSAPEERRTLGATLLRGLADQIEGKLDIASAAGTRVSLDFPLGAAEVSRAREDAIVL
jgi:two-component sensor histidine kinase